jgi:hypothetical protein
MIPVLLGLAARAIAGTAVRGGAASAASSASGVSKGAQFLNTASKVNAASNIMSHPQTNPSSQNTAPSNGAAMTSISEN